MLNNFNLINVMHFQNQYKCNTVHILLRFDCNLFYILNSIHTYTVHNNCNNNNKGWYNYVIIY